METNAIRNKITLTIPGNPVSKARPRFNSATRHAYTSEKTVKYESHVRSEFMYAYPCFKPLEGQLSVEVAAYMKIPKNTPKCLRAAMLAYEVRPTTRPDADNLIKAVLDALNNLAYVDDKQVVDCRIRKFYSDEPRVELTIQEG